MNKTKTRNFDIFYNLVKRHLLVFLNNKIRLFYTLLVPIIILAVYVLFLRELEITSVQSALEPYFKEYGALNIHKEEFMKNIMVLVDSWMLSGIVTLSTITVSLQTNNTFVEDKENGVNRDFISSPINKNILISSYFVFNFIISFLICFVVVLIAFLYLAINKEFYFDFVDFISIVVVLLVNVILNTLITVFICIFIKSSSTLSAIIAMFSTAIGFLIGAYMPISMLPIWVRNLCAFFPSTYGCGLMRYAFLSAPLSNLNDFLINNSIMSQAEVTRLFEELNNGFGYNIKFFDVSVNPQWQSLIVIVSIFVFLILNVIFGGKLTIVDDGFKKIKKESKKLMIN